MTLCGSPDDMFKMQDGTIKVVDYKTSKHSDGQDELLPIYETQLNSYALIAEKMGLGKVSGLQLIYFEPLTEITGDIDDLINNDGFLMKFEAKILPVDIKVGLILPLLSRARGIYDLSKPPGRAGCKDCKKVEEMVKCLK